MPDPLDSLGTALSSCYTIEREIGAGGMATVYLAHDVKHDRKVAVKVLRPEIAAALGSERFLREIKITANLNHPHILPLLDSGDAEGFLYYVMPYVEGESLRDRLNQEKQLPIAKVLKITSEVADALGSAHRHNVIHRDIKPENILLREGHAVVADFGIALAVTAAGGERLTETGLALGTPTYMSPEQIDWTGVDARSDIYALGVILFEMVTGVLPFDGPTPLAVAVKHQTEAPPDPRSLNDRIPQEISGIILKCLRKEKDERYHNAAELFDALDRADKHLSGGIAGPEFPAPHSVTPTVPQLETPLFVAREEEMAKLDTSLEHAIAGRGRVAFVVGDAGSGKTALLGAFARTAELVRSDLLVVEGKCDAHTGSGDPYMPFREIMALLTGDVEALFAAGTITDERARRLRDIVPLSARSVLDTGSDLIGTLLSGTGLHARAAATTPPETGWVEELRAVVERKRQVPADSTLQQVSLLEQTTRVLQTVARERPLLLVVDDVQWADSGTINLMFHLGRRLAGSRILLVGAYRPTEVALGRDGQRHPLETVVNEFQRDFGDLQIELDVVKNRRFLDLLLDSQPNSYSETFRETLLRHTGGGHPLFAIELLRNMREQGWLVQGEQGEWFEGAEIDWETVPARVDAVVEERVGRLPSQLRDILRVGSVEGEEFTAEVVARVQNLDPRELLGLLSSELEKRHHLVRAKGVSRVNGTRLSRYSFQHMLFQKHIYGDLDDVERPHLHDAVGTSLEELYGDRTHDIAVQLARHFSEAGVVEKAVEYLHVAGQRAVRVSANEEAIAHFNNALRLIDYLPQGKERVGKELALQLGVAVPLQWARGFAAPELALASVRARELCEQVRDPGHLFAALAQLALFHSTSPDYNLALELVEQLRTMAAEFDDPSPIPVAEFLQPWPLLNLGRITRAAESVEHTMELYDPARDGVTAYVFGFELGVLNLVFGAWSLWLLGFPKRARKDLDRALALARELGHPHTLAFTLVGACELHWFLRDPAAVDRYTEELAPLADEKGFIYWQAHAAFYRAERLVREGQVEDGIIRMHQAIAGMKATGTETCLTRLNTRMADACEGAGEYAEAGTAIQTALELMQKHDERYMEAEMYRHRGEILLRQGGEPAEAEADFELAIDTARHQQAMSLELRATMSIVRLWQSQGKREEGRERLATVYSRFTEGLDMPDLVDANALLASL